MGLPGPQSRCQKGRAPSEGCRGESVLSPFPASRGGLHSLACNLFLHLQSQQSSIFNYFSDPSASSFTYKEPHGYVGPTWTSQDTLPSLGQLNHNLLSIHIFILFFIDALYPLIVGITVSSKSCLVVGIYNQ